jgi:hypothetical protein
VHACRDGADVVCPCGFTLRLRFCMDARRRVRLLGTAAATDGTLVRVTATTRRLAVTPARYAPLIRRCVAKARHTLPPALHAYLARFPPPVRSMLRVA